MIVFSFCSFILNFTKFISGSSSAVANVPEAPKPGNVPEALKPGNVPEALKPGNVPETADIFKPGPNDQPSMYNSLINTLVEVI